MVSQVDYNEDIAGRYTTMSHSHYDDLVLDQLMALLVTEQKYTVPHIACRASPDDCERLPYGEWRRKIVQWCFKVVDHFRLDREVVSSALNMLDRHLASKSVSRNFGDFCPCPSCQRCVDSRYFQLAAMTCLYLAMKVNADNGEEILSPIRKLRLMSFVELSRGQFSAEDIMDMEAVLLWDLKWKVYPPTPMAAVSYLMRLMPMHQDVPLNTRKRYDLVLHVLHELARYLTELSVCLGSVCFTHSASEVAYAAILVSMDLLTFSALPTEVRDTFNESVVTTSTSAGGTILTPGDSVILFLREELRNSFWPEMLMDDCGEGDIGHPISMAKDYGLIDVSQMSHPSASSAAKNSLVHKDFEGSPVSVGRGGY